MKIDAIERSPGEVDDMKVGYLCSDIDVQLFGHEGCSVHIREFTNALVELGHEVFIICAWAGKSCQETVKARVYHLEPKGLDAKAWELIEKESLVQDHHLERDFRSVLWNGWLQSEGAKIIEEEQPDFLYERYALFGWGGIELSRRFDLPLILELNAPLCEQQNGYEKFTLTHTAEGMESEILRHADAVIALTQWLKDWAVTRGVEPDRVHVLPDAVSLRLFGEPASGEGVRRRFDLTGKRVVGFVGSFHWWHDVGGLLRAFSRLIRDDSDLRLLLVGSGEKRRSLEKKVKEAGLTHAVVFTGKIPHEEVPQHIAAMDVAVVPYQPMQDFFFSPLKLFESMAVGRPTVAADIGQIAEIIDHGYTGWLYPPGDSEKLADGIRTLLDNPEFAVEIGQSARKTVLCKHTWHNVTTDVTAVAHRLIQQRTPANRG